MGLQHLEQLQEWKNDNDPRIQEKSRIKKDEIVPYGWNEPNLSLWDKEDVGHDEE